MRKKETNGTEKTWYNGNGFNAFKPETMNKVALFSTRTTYTSIQH